MSDQVAELAEAYRAWNAEEVDSGVHVLEAVGPALEAFRRLTTRAEAAERERDGMREAAQTLYSRRYQYDLSREWRALERALRLSTPIPSEPDNGE